MAADCQEETARPSLILVDDHRMFVEMLRDSLAGYYDIAGVAHTAEGLLALLETRTADCLVLDLQLPDRSDTSLIADVRRRRPAMRILVLTMFCDRAVAEAAFAAGADGFVPKDADGAELRHAIAEVLAGRRYLSPRLPKSSHGAGLEALHPALARLTPRQQDVLCMLGCGESETEIANRLQVAPSTVTFHKRNIQCVLGLENQRALVGYAVLLNGCLRDRNGAAVAAGSAAQVDCGPATAELGGTDTPR